MDQTIKTQCVMCVGGCGMNVHLKDGKIISVDGLKEHPHNEGALCQRGASVVEYNASLDRLKVPLKRDGATWQEISWDEALEIIASKLAEIKEV